MKSRLLSILLIVVLLLALCVPLLAQATDTKETNLVGWNGSAWQRLTKGDILQSRVVYNEDFLCYSNTTTGVAVLALGSAPDNSNILTPVDWYWGTTLSTGTVKIIAGINGTAVLDTGHAAQNDSAALIWREANFGIGYKPEFQALLFVNAITNCLYEVGFYVDANDCCMFRFNPATSASKWLTVYENNNGGEVSYTTASSCEANTWYDLRIVVTTTTGAVTFYLNGQPVKTYTSAVLRNVAFKPRFYAKVTDAGHAAAKTMTVDFVRLTQNRQ